MMTFTKVVIAMLALISACTTGLGFHSMGRFSQGAFARDFLPILMAVGAFIASTCIWYWFLETYPRALAKEKQRLHILMVVSVVALFGLSTLWSVIGLGGNAALAQHMKKVTQQAEATLNGLSAQIEKENSLATQTGMLSTQFENLAGQEINGAYSNYAGRGEVAIQLTSLGETLGNMRSTIEESTRERRGTVEEAKDAIARLREIVDTQDVDPETKTRLFAKQLATLNQLFGRINAGQTTSMIREASRQLGALSATKPPMGDSDLARSQRQAIERVTPAGASAEKLLANFTGEIEESDVQLKQLSPMDMGTAIFTYAAYIIPAWAGANAFDYFPLLIIFLVAWTEGSRGRNDTEEQARQQLLEETRREIGS